MVDGVYDSDPKKNPDAALIESVYEIDENIMALADGAGTALGTGGIVTKLRAAKIATESGSDMIIMNGSDPALLYLAAEGKSVGTRFYAKRLKG
jgi:glutamate 5-kinase